MSIWQIRRWELLALVLLSCSTAGGASATPKGWPDHEDMPWLCDLDDGAWCDPSAPRSSTGNNGALCCAGGFCVEWDYGACGGVLGWCGDYSLATDPATGIVVATCHDDDPAGGQ
jgi:hypothetical protein